MLWNEPPLEEPFEEPERPDTYDIDREYEDFLLYDNKFGNNPNIDNYQLTVNTKGTGDGK